MVLILAHRDIDKRDADILHKILGKSEYEKMEEMRFGGILIYIIFIYWKKNIFSHCWRLVSFPLLENH